MEYFYIIERKGAIWELPYNEKSHKTVLEQFQNGGLIVFKSKNNQKPVTINAVDITNVLPFDEYISWIKSTSPKKYIKNGNWYDGKENKIIGKEKWKIELENKKLQKALAESENRNEKIDISKHKEKLKKIGIIK